MRCILSHADPMHAHPMHALHPIRCDVHRMQRSVCVLCSYSQPGDTHADFCHDGTDIAGFCALVARPYASVHEYVCAPRDATGTEDIVGGAIDGCKVRVILRRDDLVLCNLAC